ncbi:MAG: hypothetical protein AAFY02_10485 [Pseudomonadota bacterium]
MPQDTALLIKALLASGKISDDTREDLEDFREDLAKGRLEASDKGYVEALAARVLDGKVKVSSSRRDDEEPDEDDEDEEDFDDEAEWEALEERAETAEVRVEELEAKVEEMQRRIDALEGELAEIKNPSDQV